MGDMEASSKTHDEGDGRLRILAVTYCLLALAALLVVKLYYQHAEEMERLAVEREYAASKEALKQTVQDAVQEAVQGAMKQQSGTGAKVADVPAVEHVDTASIKLLDAMVSSGSVPQSASGKVPTARIIDLIEKIGGMGVDMAKVTPLMKLKDELLGMAKEITVAEAKKLIDKYLGLTEEGKKDGASHGGGGIAPYALNLTVYGQVNGQAAVHRPSASDGCGASGSKTPVVQKSCQVTGGASSLAGSVSSAVSASSGQ